MTVDCGLFSFMISNYLVSKPMIRFITSVLQLPLFALLCLTFLDFIDYDLKVPPTFRFIMHVEDPLSIERNQEDIAVVDL